VGRTSSRLRHPRARRCMHSRLLSAEHPDVDVFQTFHFSWHYYLSMSSTRLYYSYVHLHLGSRNMQSDNALPRGEFMMSASRNRLQKICAFPLGHAANVARRCPDARSWVKKLPPRLLARGHGAPRTRNCLPRACRPAFALGRTRPLRPISSSRIRAAAPHFAQRPSN